jgi:hypothetical protein
VLKKIALGGVALLLVLAAVVSTRPAEFRIERGAMIHAPAEVVFERVNDFHRWAEWSPWDRMDPDLKRTFEGAPAGAGAIYRWAGNGKVGEGSMTLVESRPGDHLTIKLEFLKPFTATNTTEFSFMPMAGGVNVTWSMAGRNSFVSKAMSLVMNMDQLVGKDFEKGLSALKEISETEALRRAAAGLSPR